MPLTPEQRKELEAMMDNAFQNYILMRFPDKDLKVQLLAKHALERTNDFLDTQADIYREKGLTRHSNVDSALNELGDWQ